MKIIESNWFPPKGYSAITLVWWVIVRKGYHMRRYVLNHENIHSCQQKEMLVVPFFLWYGVEFVLRFLFQYWNWDKAYRNISFEREAYCNEHNLYYLRYRKRFAWVKYLRNKKWM